MCFRMSFIYRLRWPQKKSRNALVTVGSRNSYPGYVDQANVYRCWDWSLQHVEHRPKWIYRLTFHVLIGNITHTSNRNLVCGLAIRTVWSAEAGFQHTHVFYLFCAKLTGKENPRKINKIFRFQSICFERTIGISLSIYAAKSCISTNKADLFKLTFHPYILLNENTWTPLMCLL